MGMDEDDGAKNVAPERVNRALECIEKNWNYAKEGSARKTHIVIANNTKLMPKDYANIVNSMFVKSSLDCIYKCDPTLLQ